VGAWEEGFFSGVGAWEEELHRTLSGRNFRNSESDII
jgi:hypothetical protein